MLAVMKMGRDQKFCKEILESVNINAERIHKIDISGQKKVFFITVNDVEYVFKMIEVTPVIEQEYEGNVSEISFLSIQKKEALNEKIERVKRELEMAKKCPILPQLKLLDGYRIYEEEGEFYLFYIEEKFEGITLKQYCYNHMLSIEEVLDFIEQMTKNIEIMYSNGYIHRDLTPRNIIFHDGKYRVIDGGLCRYIHDDAKLTRTPDLVGTPRYASSEQFKRPSDFAWDFRTDLFPLGLIGIEMFVEGAKEFNEDHLRDMDYIYSKWKPKNKKNNYAFSKLIVRLSNENVARRFDNFKEIYDLLNELKRMECE